MTLGRRSCIHCLSSLISLTFLVQLLQAQSDIFSTLSHANELSSKGDYGEALRILEPLVQSKTVEPAETGRVWIQLGSVYQDLGRYPEAQRAYQTAISLFKNRPGREREERVALDDLGSLYLDLGQAEMSRRLRLQVLKSAAATEDHAAVARAYNNLSAASIQQRDWKEARKWLANAQAEVKLMPKVRADDLAAIHCNAGWLSEHDHDYEQALKYYEAALQSWTEQHGINHQLTGSGYVLRGRMRTLLGNTREGLEDIEKGAAIIEKIVGTKVPIYFAARLAYADALSAAGFTKEGKAIRSSAKHSLESFRSTSPQFPISVDAFR